MSGRPPDQLAREVAYLRGNVEAGLRLLLKSERPLYRRAAEVGMEDLADLNERLAAIERYAKRLDDERSLDGIAPLGRHVVAQDLLSLLDGTNEWSV